MRPVGNVEWEGIALETLLAYQKDLPLHIAQSGKLLLARHLNNLPLSAELGAPLYLIVSDFYGANATKW
jgi:DMSO/TMAO reductase YedYZ molybdopterin-dependent catalytic subunit